MVFLFDLLGWSNKAWAAYSDAPTLSTSGSAAYSTIATTINSWKNAWTVGTNASNNTNDAYTNRSAIIDQVEATLLAAGKGTITDAEYDVLADALYYWLHQVADEGSRATASGGHYNNRGGWYINGIGIPEDFFGKYPNDAQGNPGADFNGSQCVWELRQTTCPIAGTGYNGYGPMLGSNTRLVLVTSQSSTTITRNHEHCNVMFSTNGVNSKLLILGRKNNKIVLQGEAPSTWSDPSSYSSVLARDVSTGQRGQAVVVNGGSLMTAYTTFERNISNTAKCSYHEFTTNPAVHNADGTTVEGGTTITYSEGGAIGVTGTMNCCSFYYTTIENNSTSQDAKFGGGIGFRDVATKTSGTNGNVYFNHCTIKGNRNGSHGGGLAFYYNTAADGRNVYIKDTEISYNCQKSFGSTQIEAHGGGFWVVNAYNSDPTQQRRVFFDGCTFTGNYSDGRTAAGGAISNEGTISLVGTSFNSNVADNSFGGAIYNRPQMAEGATKGVDLTVSGCTFNNNRATWTADVTDITNSNPTRGSGGAIMIDVFRVSSYSVAENYIIKLDIEGSCTFTNNHADRCGGAIAVVASADMESWIDNPPSGHGTLTSNMEIKSATMTGNTAGKSGAAWPSGRHDYGGAIYLSYTNLNVTGSNANVQIKNNGNVGSHTATQYGGAVAIYKGNLSLSGGTFGASGSGNKATYGGAFYINQGTVSLTGGNIQYNTATEQGGGLYTTGNGTITVSGVIIDHNTAKAGGGIYTNNNAATNFNMTNGNISNNSATAGNGGGVCLNDKTTLKLSTGSITSNSASSNGGGVYLGANSSLELSGSGTITSNSASSGQGGGVYMGGSMKVDGTSLNVSNNMAGRATNNVYLPSGKTINVGTNISPNVTLGIYTEKTYDTYPGDIPVLTTTTGNEGKLLAIYSAMTNGQSNIRDDRGMHKAKYTSGDRTLYFTKVFFDYPAYTSDFSNPIDSKAKLYQFMCWVNGVNGYGEKHSDATGNVTADIDMSGINYWIPIGEHNIISSTTPYIGSFNGNGHIISNLSFNDGLVEDWGVFGAIDNGALLTDVYVQNVNFATKLTQGSIGSLVGDMKGGTVKNCIGSGTLTSTHADCVIGGLVGSQEGGTIHSSSAMSTMTGYQMGGLVGDLAAGCSIYNSFANASFSPQSGSTKYMGGLVGVNKGTVENCYSRVRGTVPGATYFGWLAGDNTSGTLNSSYIPTAYSNYTATSKTGTQNNLNKYAPVIAPYLYNRTGDNAVGSTTLLAILNSWVSDHSGYANWKRTTAGGYSAGAGNINDDYPIHKYTDYKCVASTDGIVLDYAANLDAMLTRHTSDATINLYAHDNTSKGTGNNEMVYIDENISLLQSTSNAITAYTCQTLPGSTRSWHFLSSSLTNSGIGFNYGTSSQVPFSWAENPCNVTFSATDDQALYPHDVPNINLVDLYCFYEPEYHWMNLKRNSNSHWHMNATTVPITYTNETTLTPGKGYLVSIAQDQLLQNKGTLNNGNVPVTLSYTPANAWAGLLGYNLIGNPYQSYLDFSSFASKNMSLWADKGCEPTYAVYDAEMGGYIQYKEGISRGAKAANGIINMHQGFMVRTASATTVTFTNTMRTNDGTTTGIRGEQPAYPLINLIVTDDEGVNDFAVLELGRDANAGAEKLRANDSKGWLYLRHGIDNYGILFRTEVEDYQPLWFEAEEEGSYTLTWETANAEFEALTLVDNITGAITDMLAHDSYTFEATPEQYASRFKIVIGDYKDIEEYEGGASTGSATAAFAYYANGEIYLAETSQGASLQIMDVTGRVIVSRDGVHTVSTNGMTPGVYILRLTDGKETKTQKIVIE